MCVVLVDWVFLLFWVWDFFLFGLVFLTRINLLRDIAMQESLSQSYLLLLLWAGMLFLGITSWPFFWEYPCFYKEMELLQWWFFLGGPQ